LSIFVNKRKREIYRPILSFAMRHRRVVLTSAILLFSGSLILVPFIGREFVPAMDEGSIVINILRLPSIALEDSLDISSTIEKELMKFPEVKTVVSRTGTDEIGTDPMGPELSDVFITLKPSDECNKIAFFYNPLVRLLAGLSS
jgi:cobalt-zinc-cadmium resistance protein CzcA